jgi:hypothetical protein
MACILQVPEFNVNSERSGRVMHSFTGLSAHHETVLEPTEWRDAEESDNGRSLILWTSRTPGITLSMHRRPDGTFSGVFGGSQDIFEAIDSKAAAVIEKADSRGPNRATVGFVSMTQAKLDTELQRGQTVTRSNSKPIEQRKAEVQKWIKSWRSGRLEERKAEVQEWIKAWRAPSAVDQLRALEYKHTLLKALGFQKTGQMQLHDRYPRKPFHAYKCSCFVWRCSSCVHLWS